MQKNAEKVTGGPSPGGRGRRHAGRDPESSAHRIDAGADATAPERRAVTCKIPLRPLSKGGSPPAPGEGPPLECGLPARNGKPARAGGGANRRGRPPCLPREALADRASTSAKYLSRIETGNENPTIDLLLRLADGLNVEPYEMLCFEEGELVRQLRTRVVKLIDEVPDKDLARVVGLLEAVLH